jgi:hypothetical protein
MPLGRDFDDVDPDELSKLPKLCIVPFVIWLRPIGSLRCLVKVARYQEIARHTVEPLDLDLIVQKYSDVIVEIR